MRDRLLLEIADLSSVGAATSWAPAAIKAKNELTAADARFVEEAFAAKLVELQPETADAPIAAETPSTPASLPPNPPVEADVPAGIDKSVLAVGEPRRHRNKHHLRFVAKQACLVCGRKHSDPHHLGFMQPRALGRKVSDEFVVPLCRIHHREVHRAGDERAWWQKTGIDPIEVAYSLWGNTRLNKRPPEIEPTQDFVGPPTAARSGDGTDLAGAQT